jgi:hypothetical protein
MCIRVYIHACTRTGSCYTHCVYGLAMGLETAIVRHSLVVLRCHYIRNPFYLSK